MYKRTDAKARFMKHVEMVPFSGCWIWMGGTAGPGQYGNFSLDLKTVRAHHASYRFFSGEIPSDKQVLHTCDVPLCVNPEHLFLGTHQDNMDDRGNKNRQAKGTRQHLSKLSEQDVLAIRSSNSNSRTLAKLYGVHQTTICDAKRGYTWNHVQGESK